MDTLVPSFIAAGVWAFLTGHPSPVSLILAALFIFYLLLGYCYLAITVPVWDPSLGQEPQFRPQISDRAQRAIAEQEAQMQQAETIKPIPLPDNIQRAIETQWAEQKKGR